MGSTVFNSKGAVTGILIARWIEEDGTAAADRRVRSTLSHEGGHGLLHPKLFIAEQTGDLFGRHKPGAPTSQELHVPQLRHFPGRLRGAKIRWEVVGMAGQPCNRRIAPAETPCPPARLPFHRANPVRPGTQRIPPDHSRAGGRQNLRRKSRRRQNPPPRDVSQRGKHDSPKSLTCKLSELTVMTCRKSNRRNAFKSSLSTGVDLKASSRQRFSRTGKRNRGRGWSSTSI